MMSQTEALAEIRKHPEGISTLELAHILVHPYNIYATRKVNGWCTPLVKYKLVRKEIHDYGGGRRYNFWYPEQNI